MEYFEVNFSGSPDRQMNVSQDKFRVRLIRRPSAAGDKSVTWTQTALIVEAEDFERERLSSEFLSHGYHSRGVSSGREAMSWLTAEHSPTLVLLGLLEAGGPEGTKAVIDLTQRKAPAATVVIALTPETLPLATDIKFTGAFCIVGKPVDAKKVVDLTRASESTRSGTHALARANWAHIQRVLALCNGNRSKAADQLGVTRRGLQMMLNKTPPTF